MIEVDSERAQYWLSVGAQPTEAVIALLKRTGDWQRYSGDTSPSGVLPQPEKKNKTDAFNAALAEAGSEPDQPRRPPAGAPADPNQPVRSRQSGRPKPVGPKPASPKSEPASQSEAKVEGTPEEAQEAADAGVADADTAPPTRRDRAG